RPELRAVHRRVRAARVGELARPLAIERSVHRVELDARHRGVRPWVERVQRVHGRPPEARRSTAQATRGGSTTYSIRYVTRPGTGTRTSTTGASMSAERLISADDHVDVSHDSVKGHLASKFHDDYDAGLMRFRTSMSSTASVAANEQW